MVSTLASAPSSVLSPPGDLALRVHGSSLDGQIIRLRSTKCTIGSGPQCTLRLRAAGIRATHCLIVRGASGMIVRCLSPGTRLNGHCFADAHLVAGDRLTIGPVELEILGKDGLSQPTRRRDEPAPVSGENGSPETRLSDELLAAQSQNRDLLTQLQTVRQQLSAVEAEHRLAIQQRESLEAQPVATTSSENDQVALAAERQALTVRMEELERETNRLGQLRSDLEQQRVALQKEQDRLRGEQVAFEDAQQQAHRDLDRQFDLLTQDRQQTQQLLAEWQQERRQAQLDLAEQLGEVDRQRQLFLEQEAKEALRLSEQAAAVAADLAELEKQRLGLAEQRRALDVERETLAAQHAAVGYSGEAATIELQNKAKQIEAQAVELAEQRRAVEQYRQRLDSAASAEAELAAARQRIVSLEAQLSITEAESAELTGVASERQQEILQLEQQIAGLRQQISTLEEQLDELRDQLRQAESKGQQSSDQFEQQFSDLRKQESQLADERQQLARDRSELEPTLSSERARVEARLQELSVREQQLDARSQELEAQGSQLAQLQSQLAEQQEAIANHEESAAAQTKKLAERSREIDQQYEELERLRRQFEEQRSQAAEVASSGVDNQQQEELAALRNQLTEMASQLQAERDALDAEKQIFAEGSGNDSATDQLQAELEAREQELEQRAEELRQQRDAFEAERTTIQERLRNRSAELDERQIELDCQFEQLSQQPQIPAIAAPTVNADEPSAVSASVEQRSNEEPEGDDSQDVFERLRRLAMLKDESSDDEPQSGDEPVAVAEPEDAPPEPALFTPAPVAAVPPVPPVPTTSSTSDDDEESIDDYMAQLLNRVRGGSDSSAPAVAQPAISRPAISLDELRGKTASPAAVSAPAPETAAPGEPKVAPRAERTKIAPPETADLSKMRELANLQTRAAIATHASKGSVREAAWRWIVAGVSGGLTAFGALNCSPDDYVTLSLVGVGACVTLFWSFLALRGTKRFMAARRERRPKEAAVGKTQANDVVEVEAVEE